MEGRVRLKTVLIGDQGVSKTNVIRNFRESLKHIQTQTQTLIVQRYNSNELEVYFERKYLMDRRKIAMVVWDTCGQEKYRSLTASYYRGAHGCLILYDVTKESSFENLSHWLADLREYTTQPEISTIIVGTKCHVPEDRREVTFERAQKFAESLNLPYMEVSAEEGINITEVFEKLADLIIESLNKDAVLTQIQQKNVILDSKPKKKQQWCSC